jgi:molybdate transport system substrate-binding protein
MIRRNFLTRLTALAAIIAASLAASAAQAAEIHVFAAASLKNALDGIAKEWKSETGNDAVVTYAASSALAKQIEAGAPADLFISADLKWMDYLEKGGLINKDSRDNLLGNSLVLVEGKDNPKQYEIAKGFDLAGALAAGRLAVGQTDAVPAGRYAKAALQSLDIWDSVKDKLAEAENVRAALLLVSRGEAPLGIVYMTDTKADAGVKVAGTFPEGSHPPIIYPAAIVKASTTPAAADFEKYLRSKKAESIFTDQGFRLLSPQ